MQLSLHSELVTVMVILEVAPKSRAFSGASFASHKEAFLVACWLLVHIPFGKV